MPTMTASPFGALAVIATRTRGRGGSDASSPRWSARLARPRSGVLRAQSPTALADATRLATAALDDGRRFLVAVGDDGTVQDVVNGMFRDGRPIVDEPVLGVVAADSGCDLVRSFGLPGDVDGGVRPPGG